MSIQELYDVLEGDYQGTMGRLMKEDRIKKYLGKFIDAGDYQEVWDFFVEHCPNAEITAPITGQQYDEFYEIERDQEQE